MSTNLSTKTIKALRKICRQIGRDKIDKNDKKFRAQFLCFTSFCTVECIWWVTHLVCIANNTFLIENCVLQRVKIQVKLQTYFQIWLMKAKQNHESRSSVGFFGSWIRGESHIKNILMGPFEQTNGSSDDGHKWD